MKAEWKGTGIFTDEPQFDADLAPVVNALWRLRHDELTRENQSCDSVRYERLTSPYEATILAYVSGNVEHYRWLREALMDRSSETLSWFTDQLVTESRMQRDHALAQEARDQMADLGFEHAWSLDDAQVLAFMARSPSAHMVSVIAEQHLALDDSEHDHVTTSERVGHVFH